MSECTYVCLCVCTYIRMYVCTCMQVLHIVHLIVFVFLFHQLDCQSHQHPRPRQGGGDRHRRPHRPVQRKTGELRQPVPREDGGIPFRFGPSGGMVGGDR